MKKKTNVPGAAKIAAGKKVMDKALVMKGEGKAGSAKVKKEAKPGCKYPKGGI